MRILKQKRETPAQSAARARINQECATCHWCERPSLYMFGPLGACAKHKDELRPTLVKHAARKDVQFAARLEEKIANLDQPHSRTPSTNPRRAKLRFVG